MHRTPHTRRAVPTLVLSALPALVVLALLAALGLLPAGAAAAADGVHPHARHAAHHPRLARHAARTHHRRRHPAPAASGTPTTPASPAGANGSTGSTGSSSSTATSSTSTTTSTTGYHVDALLGSDLIGTGSALLPWRSIQHAVDTAPAGSTITVDPGVYPSFVLDRPQTVVGASRTGVIVTSATATDLIDVVAAGSGSRISSLTVTGCVPDAHPVGGFDDNPSSGIRVDDGAHDVVIDSVTVRDNETAGTYRTGCQGVFLHDARDVTVSNSEIDHNGSGIFVHGAGGGVRLVGNDIHDNDAMIRNTPTSVNGDDDFGGVGIGFMDTTDAPGPVATGNTIAHNRATSYDYGVDGGGFEIFQASHVTMSDNTIADNDDVLETGTSSSSLPCADNVFTDNTTSGTTAADPRSLSRGLILRCAEDMSITGNRIDHADWWAFVIGGDDTFSSGVAGLTISGNTVTQTHDQVFASTAAPAAWGATIDHNSFHWTCSSDYYFATLPSGRTPDLAGWRGASPFDAASTGSCS